MTNAKDLAPFQRDTVEKIRAEHAAGRRTLLCLPTGTGKTRVAVNYAFDDFVAHERPVLWIAHTQELLQQAYETFRSVGVTPDRMARRFGELDELRYVTEPLVSFVSNAGQQGPGQPDLVIVDEAHHAAGKTYTGWLSLYRTFARDGARLLGLTATPYRLDDGEITHLTSFGFSKPRVPIFESVAYERSFCELVDMERVAPFIPEQIETHLAISPRVKNGEVSPETLDELNTPRRNRIIVDALRLNRHRWGKTIVFVGRSDHAKALARAFGRDGDYLSTDNAAERHDVLRRFRNGEVPVLVNVRMLGEGLDVPDVQTVIIARPTMSPMLYIQMVGRGARITHSKRFFYLVDVHDQLGEFERYLAGKEDLAERKPWLLDVNARRAQAARAATTSVDAPVVPQAREPLIPPASLDIDGYLATLRTLRGMVQSGGLEALSALHPLACWWETPSRTGGVAATLVVLRDDEPIVSQRIQVVRLCLLEGRPLPSEWPEKLRAMPEEVFGRFAEVLVERRGVAVAWTASTWPGRLPFALDNALNTNWLTRHS